MIINICGTSGSGKSTLMRSVMARYDGKFVFRVEGRKQPIGYLMTKKGHRSLAVVGHYETACGGCDTISSMDTIYAKVREAAAAGHDVLYEGLLISAEYHRRLALHTDGLGLHVIEMDVPLDLCVASINMRRQAKTPGKGDVNPKNTEQKWKGTRATVRKLREAGVPCHTLNREEALSKVVELLGLGLPV